MKRITNRKGCIDGVMSGNCITWDGPNIPCLDICTGDTLTTVIAEFATKFCEVLEDLNMEDADLSCIINLPPLTTSEKTVKKIIELLLQNQCDLRDLIQETPGSEEDTFNVNLKCLKVYDDFDQEVPQTRDQAIQLIINEVCDHRDEIEEIKTDIVNLQQQIDDIDVTPTVTLPNVATCVNPVAVPLDDAMQAVASEVCDIKEGLGTLEDMQNAITKQCAGLAADINNPAGFIATVTNLSESITNMWLTVCNVLNRVKSIETTCCTPTCDNVGIGFSLILDGESTTDYLVRFRSSDGTNLPAGTVDVGSKILFTGSNGVKFFAGVQVPVDVTLPEGGAGSENIYNLTGLTSPIKVDLLAKIQFNGITCEKCISQTVDLDNGCPVCEVIAGGNKGDVGQVTITYEY